MCPTEPQFWYWEVFECFRKLFLSAIISFILPGTVSQVGLAMVIVMLVCILYGKYSPYIDGRQVLSYPRTSPLIILL